MEGSYYEQIKAENVEFAKLAIRSINAHIENVEALHQGQKDALHDIKILVSKAFDSDDKDKSMITISVLSKTIKALQGVVHEEVSLIDEHIKELKGVFFHIK